MYVCMTASYDVWKNNGLGSKWKKNILGFRELDLPRYFVVKQINFEHLSMVDVATRI